MEFWEKSVGTSIFFIDRLGFARFLPRGLCFKPTKFLLQILRRLTFCVCLRMILQSPEENNEGRVPGRHFQTI
jgi:hypothetical protein